MGANIFTCGCEKTLTSLAQKTASQITLRNCSKEVREEPRYIGIFAENKTKARVIKQKDYCKSQKAGISS